MSTLGLSFLIVSVVFFVAFILFSIFNYKKRFRLEYHLRSHFPYELNYKMHFKDNVYGNICAILFTVALIGFAATFDQTFSNGFFIFAMVDLILLSVVIFILLFLPINSIRPHLAMDALLFAFAFLLSGSIMIGAFYLNQNNKQINYIVVICLSIIIVGLQFFLLLNPKLTKWTEMDKKINDDGSTQLVRPKYFVLAYTEWALIISTFINIILLLILTIK